MKIIALLLLAFSVMQPALATNYYVCDTGNDSNAGSQSAPFKTFDKAISTFNKISGGESVLFCKGGKFKQPNRKDIFNQKCSATAPCTLGAYGSGNRPEIFSTTPNASIHFSDGGPPDPSGGYVVKDLHLLSDGSTKFGVELINDVDDVTLDNLKIQGFEMGIYSAPSNGFTGNAVNGINDRLTLKNSFIVDNHGQGWLGGGIDVLIENNVFQNNGYAKAVFNHNIYLSGKDHNPSNRITVRGNTLYKSAVVNGKCQGVSLVGHGLISNLTIEDNLIKEDAGTAGFGCWGIAIDPGYTMQERFIGLTIRNNIIENLGGMGIGCASCVDVVIEGNTITDTGGTSREGINIPNREEDSLKSSNIKVLNNTINLAGRADAVCVKTPSNISTVSGNKCSTNGSVSVQPVIAAPIKPVVVKPVITEQESPVIEPENELYLDEGVDRDLAFGFLTRIENFGKTQTNSKASYRASERLLDSADDDLKYIKAMRSLLHQAK